jgi:hypothetical protein
MRKRQALPTSDQTSLVDTFTCAIAILFVLILSLQASSTQVSSIVTPEIVLSCSTAGDGTGPLFRFASDPPGAALFDAGKTQDRLETLVAVQSLSMRITITHAPEDDICRDRARLLVDDHNEQAIARPEGVRIERPYLILDVVARFDAEARSSGNGP